MVQMKPVDINKGLNFRYTRLSNFIQ